MSNNENNSNNESNVSAIFTSNAMLITFDGNTHTVDNSNPYYDDIFKHMKNGNFDEARKLCEITFEIINWGDEELTVLGGEIAFKGVSLGDKFTRRMLAMMKENQDREPLKLFLSNLFKNPSNRSIEQVPDFIHACNLPITNRGTILAYKKVTDDFKDFRTGLIDNSPGQSVKEDRRLISDDPDEPCARGLHVCSLDYLSNSGLFQNGKFIIVEVNPEHIVAVPKDYSFTKMRVCEYYVLEEFAGEDPTEIYEKESVWSIKPEQNYTSPFDDSKFEDLEDEEGEEDFESDGDLGYNLSNGDEDLEENYLDDLEEDLKEYIQREKRKKEKTQQKLRTKACIQPRDASGKFIKST